ncbi:ankyrin repeat domain-containing protein [Erwiniaceae bacterium L1_54_3]|nr:ankyrin repeat domain-containing protein [Pantoea formicae]MDF7647064.1 ankyrin repeat domain-containing protein [Erwiniaceae bacterium L1_54_3]
MIKLVRKVLKIIPLIAFFSIINVGCASMNTSSPENYFSGSQLQLAQEIKAGKKDEVLSFIPQVDLNKPGNQNMTLLMYSLLSASDNKTKGSFEIVSALVKAGADPLYNIPDYGSAAEVMATSDDPRYLKALIDGGLDKNAISNYRPLIINATSEHSRKVLEYLVEIGADVDNPDSAGKTALMVGLGSYDLDEVEYLLSHGANPNIKNKAGWGFREMLQKKLTKGSDDVTERKLNEIKNLAESKGMKRF